MTSERSISTEGRVIACSRTRLRAGIFTTILVADHEEYEVAFTAPNFTYEDPRVEPNVVPLMVTYLPTYCLAGDIDVIFAFSDTPIGTDGDPAGGVL